MILLPRIDFYFHVIILLPHNDFTAAYRFYYFVMIFLQCSDFTTM